LQVQSACFSFFSSAKQPAIDNEHFVAENPERARDREKLTKHGKRMGVLDDAFEPKYTNKSP
jgi:hypothetical protein